MQLRNARIIDGHGDEAYVGNVEFDEYVTSVERVETDVAEVKYTLMPGMIDAHSHLSMTGEQFDWWRNEESTAAIVLRTYRNANRHLDAGETSVRDLGGIKDTVIQLRNSIKAGVVEGPRIYACGRWLNVAGGHGDIYGEPATGRDGFTNATRKLLHEGADVIKVMATAGALAEEGKNPNTTQVTDEELGAVAEACKAAGVPMAVHAHSSDGMRMAIKHGAVSIEHATWLEDDIVLAARETGTAFIPTFAICEVMMSKERGGFERRGPAQAAISDRMADVKIPALKRAIELGARIVAGCDSGAPGTDHGVVADEVRNLMAIGLAPMEAIKAATSYASEVVDGGKSGAIQSGKFADMIVVEGDPLTDPTALKNIVAVLLGGRVVRGELPAEMIAV